MSCFLMLIVKESGANYFCSLFFVFCMRNEVD